MSAWVSRVFFPLAIAGIEWAWVYPWLAWWTGPAAFGLGSPLTPGSAWLIITVGAVVAALRRPDLPARVLQAAALLVGLGVVGFGLWRDHFPAEAGLAWLPRLGEALLETFRQPTAPAVGFWAGLGLYWRGLTVGTAEADYDDLYREFTLGLGAQVALFLLNRLRPDPAVGQAALGYLVILFTVGLAALALGRLDEILRRVRRAGREGPGVSGPWLLTLAATVLTILAGALGAAFLLLQEPPAGVRAVLDLASQLLLAALFIVLLPLGLLAELLVTLLGPLIRRVWIQLQMPTLSQFGEEAGRTGQAPVELLPPAIVQGLRWLLVAAVLAVALGLVALAVTRYRRRRAEADVEEVRQSVWSWREALAGLRARLRALLAKLRPRRLQPGPGETAGAVSPEARTVREVYREFLRLMARLGRPRRPEETPLEFLGRVRPDILPVAGEAEEVTAAYLQVRYGERSLPRPAAGRIREAWGKIRQSLSRQP